MSGLSKRTPRAFFPVLVICVLAFILYTIIDSGILYKHISVIGMICSAIVFILLVYVIVRFTLIRYEYLVVGSDLIIRRRSPLRVIGIQTYELENIESIGEEARFKHLTHAKRYNCCNSILATLFSGKVMLYHNKDKSRLQRVIIDPPEEVRRVLKLNLQERYQK